MNLFQDIKDLISSVVSGEPAVTVGVLASVLVFIAGKAHIILDDASLQAVLTPLVTAVLARFFVVPASKVASLPAGDPRGEHARKTS